MHIHVDFFCEHGFSHGGCKCWQTTREMRIVECNNPKHQEEEPDTTKTKSP